MADEQAIQADLAAAFPALADTIRIQRVRRLFVDVPSELLPQVFDHLVKKMQFGILCTITGLDQGATFGVIYHLARENGVVLNLCTSVPREKPVIKTVTAYFPAADLYERELVDLLGFQVDGLPPGNRYPLPDGWPADQHPLRKDWKPAESGAGAAGPDEVVK